MPRRDIMSFSYLASPYSHPNPEIMEMRYAEALRCVGWLISHSVWVYSPIVHCHELAKRNTMPTDAEHWRAYDHAMLQEASRLLILTLEGWEDSKGVNDEVTTAHALGILIHFISPNTYKIYEEPQ
jgi:Domain of unknown function (DUF1937)